MTGIKICGIKNLEEARTVKQCGAWALGEVFAESSRRIDMETAAKMNRYLGNSIVKIGVFVNEDIDSLQYIIRECHLDMVQLHGDEKPEYAGELTIPVIKSFPANGDINRKQLDKWKVYAWLFDTYSDGARGGTGKSFDWQYLKEIKEVGRIILAGGLNQINVGRAIREINPWAVDVSSGVEYSHGGKSPKKIEQFVHAVKEAERYVSG